MEISTPENLKTKPRWHRFWENTWLDSHRPEQLSPERLNEYEDQFEKGHGIHKGVAGNLDRIVKHWVAGRIDGASARIRLSQFRALDSLYGARAAKPESELADNPLVDVLELISNPGAISPGMDLQLAIAGPPEQLEHFFAEDSVKKQKQYSFTENKLGERTVFRTLSRFGQWQRTIARGLYILARATDRYPELLKQTLDEYVDIATEKQGSRAGMAVGILELLFNMEVLDHPKFSRFSHSLRRLVLDDVGGYERLKQQWYYRVTAYSPFWLEGAKIQGGERAILYGQEKIDTEGQEQTRLRFPSVETWDVSVRQRNENVQVLSALTPVNAIVKTAQKSERSLDTFTADIRSALRHRAELTEEVRLQDRRQPQALKKAWSDWLTGFAQDRKTTPGDSLTIEGATTLVLKHFLGDKKLSRKSATRITVPNELYALKPESLNQDALFNWVFTLRDEQRVADLEKAITEEPAAFSLLLRLMTYETAEKFFRKKETGLLFDPRYREKADPTSLIRLVREIRDMVNRHRPDIKKIFLETVAEGDKPVREFLQRERLKHIQKNLKALIYEEPVPGVSFDKARKMTRRSFLKLGGGLLLGLLSGGEMILLGSVIINLVKKIGGGGEGGIPSPASEDLRQLVDAVRERTPDAISPEELKKRKPLFYGRLLQLPKKYFSGVDAEPLGYFPVTLFELTGQKFINPVNEFKDVIKVDNLSDVKLSPSPDQLVVAPNKIADVMFAPIGWKIVSVVQEKGTKPQVGIFGELDYAGAPKKAILMMEKIPPDKLVPLSSGVTYGLGTAETKWAIGLQWQPKEAEEVNGQLGKDPVLQQLQRAFIDEVSRTDKDDVEKLSKIAIDYTLRYEKYTHDHRFYALGFSVAASYPNSYNSLRAIADHPDQGYYCTVASQAYRQFMRSAGFFALDQPGFKVQNHNNQLWAGLGHQNNLVLLPNGKILYVDVTPQITEKTPKEDIEALRPKVPAPQDILFREDLSSIAALAVKYGAGVATTGVALSALLGLVGEGRHRLAVWQVERFLSKTKSFSPLEQDLLACVVNQLAYLPYNTGFYTEAARILDALNAFSPQKHGPGIQWLVANHVGLLHKDDVKLAYAQLQNYYRKEPQVLRSYFPESFDFEVVYALARVVNQSKFNRFKREVLQKLEVETGTEQAKAQAAYKAADIREMVRERLYDDVFRRRHLVKGESIPYFQALYTTLQGFPAKGQTLPS